MSICSALYLVTQQLCTFDASRCVHISLPSLHDYDVKVTYFTFFGGRGHKETTFFLFSWISIQYSVPEKITNIWRIERDGISATNWLKSRWAGFINSGENKISHSTSVPFWICPEAGFSSNFPGLDTRKIRRRTLLSATLSRKKPCPVTADPYTLLKNKSISPYFV